MVEMGLSSSAAPGLSPLPRDNRLPEFHAIVPKEASESQLKEAHEAGVVIGGAATLYDACARAGRLGDTKPDAEATFNESFTTPLRNVAQQQVRDAMLEGWNEAKKSINSTTSILTTELCDRNAKQWIGMQRAVSSFVH